MIRTTRNEVRTSIRRLILDHYYGTADKGDFKAVAKDIHSAFMKETGFAQGRNEHDEFVRWCCGGGSMVFDTCDWLYYADAFQILSNVLQYTDEDKRQYEDANGPKFICHLIYREISATLR